MKKNYLKMLGMFCLSLYAVNINAQTTYYVKTDGTGAAATATTWGTASKDLQEVINNAQSGDKIFVATGTYLPNRPANNLTTVDAANRDNAFVLKNGVSVYGGFAGTEADETQRTTGNSSTLSGDLNGNDAEETGANTATYMTVNKADNAYHVVLAIGINANTIFDGFAITKGDASVNSTLTVNSNAIDSRFGAGFYILNSSASLKIYNARVTVHRAVGDGGSGVASGAGFYINNSSPTIDNVEISRCFNTNATPKTGGYNYGSGMSLMTASSPSITNTTFSDNFGSYGAALSINSGNATFTNCTFKLNRSNNGRGGAIDLRGGSPVFANCLFSENSVGSAEGGGAVFNYSARPNFINCIFYKNSTSGNGAVYATGNTRHYGAIFINNTFYDNRNTKTANASSYTAGIHILGANTGAVFTDKKTYLYNNIFSNNNFTVATSGTNTPDLYVIDATTLLGTVSNNIIQQTESVPANQNNQINVNPQFISTTPGHIAFLAPENSSPAKDAGEGTHNSSGLDFNGRARKNGTIDIGAVEYYTILPVSLISFIAKATTGGAQLDWKVGSETNNKQYIISRSSDGKKYNLVAKVAGIGTVPAAKRYSFIDQTGTSGTYYYKLEQEDLDGEVNYLATQVVKIGVSTNSVSIYPNPTNGRATLALTAGDYNKYNVISLQGNTVFSGDIASSDKQININLSGLATGTYVIKMTGANGHSSLRVIKI